MQTKDLMEIVGIDSKQPLIDRILEHMGSMYTALGKPDEGLPFYLKSIEIQEHLLGTYQNQNLEPFWWEKNQNLEPLWLNFFATEIYCPKRFTITVEYADTSKFESCIESLRRDC